MPEGSYKPRVHLVGQHRTIVLPNPMRVDVTAPHIRLVSLAPRVFSPDGDGRKERIIARYVIDEPAQALLYVNGIQRVRKRGQQEKGRIEWFGKVDGASLPPGVYRISLGSRDVAGNLGPRTPEKKVLIRYVALGRDRIETVAGARFAVLVLSDAARVQWKLGKRTGTRAPGNVEAPRPGAAGPVHADGDRQRVQRPCGRDRAGTEAMTTLAQIAGPVGCAGLALLLVATRRDLRIAGLAAWALGLGGLALYLAPDVSSSLLVAGAVAGLVATVAGAWLLTRYPYLLAFATLACLPVRLPITIGSEKASLLLPLYAVVSMLALSLAWQLHPRRYAHARARPGRLAACRRRLLDRALARLDARPEEGLDLPRRLHPPVRAPGDRLRAAAVAWPLAHLALGRRSS